MESPTHKRNRTRNYSRSNKVIKRRRSPCLPNRNGLWLRSRCDQGSSRTKNLSGKRKACRQSLNRSCVFKSHVRKPNYRSEEHTSELQSRFDLVCGLLLEKKKVEGAHLAGC